MVLTIEGLRNRLENLCRDHRQLKRGGNVDPYVLEEDLRSFINMAQSGDERCEEMVKDAEDMLIDLRFTLQQDRCAPIKSKPPNSRADRPTKPRKVQI